MMNSKTRKIIDNINMSKDGKLMIENRQLTDYSINVICQRIKAVEGKDINMNDLIELIKEKGQVIEDNTPEILTELNDIINSDDNIENSEWEKFNIWKINDAIWNINKDGEKTGLNECFENIVGFIENCPKTKGKIKFNNVRNLVEFNGRQVTDSDIHTIMGYITKYFIDKFSKLRMVKDAIDNVAFKNRYNRWVDYFNGLEYVDDGIDYIDYTIKNVLCCEEQDKYYDLYYETLKIMMLASMSRIYNKELYGIPTKYDIVVTLCGRNGGSGKTTFFERLYDIDNNGNSYCYVVSGDSFQPKDKDFIERSHQSVCLFLDEISMKRAIVTSVKGYITQRDDRFRKAYGYNNESHIRGFIITASSNNDDILKDYTTDNERRWAIIKISEDINNYKKVNEAFDNGYRDKIWSFIKNIYDNEEWKLYMTDERLIKLEKEIQRSYKASNNDDYNTIIYDLLEREYGYYSANDKIYIDTDYICEQYLFGDSKEWCKRHNEEISEKIKKSKEDKYILRPNEKMITKFGKINRISKKQLFDILDKLHFEYTKISLNAEMRYSDIWNGLDKGKNSCWINGSIVNGYWRKENENIQNWQDFNYLL